MNNRGWNYTGSVAQVSDVKVVALYEPDTGNIIHVHTVTVFEGAQGVSETEAIQEAQAEASRLGHEVARLKTQVSLNHEHGSRPHRIDPKTNQFVPVESPNLIIPKAR